MGVRWGLAAWIVLFAGALSARETRIGAIQPFQSPEEKGVETRLRETLRRSLQNLEIQAEDAGENRPDGKGDYFATIYYSRGAAGALNLYGQIYDSAESTLIDAVSITDESIRGAGIALPAEETRGSDEETISRFANRMAVRIKGNPRKVERTENIQESLLSLEIGRKIQFPIRRSDTSGEVFRMLEDQRIVTATRQATRVKEAPAAVHVITEEQIRQRGYRTLTDALHDAPGFDIIHVYGIFPDLIHQRGLVGNNQRTLVYVDGILDNNLTENGVLGGTLRFPLYNVERIEVIGGPASALYGANAFNGVINIITKDGTSPGGGVQALGGWSEDNFHNPGGGGSISARGTTGDADLRFSYSAAATYLKSAGPYFGDMQHLDKRNANANDAAYYTETQFCGGVCNPDAKSIGYWWSKYYDSPEDTYNITARFSAGGFRFETINWQYLQGNGTFSNGTQQIDTDRIKGFRGASWDFRNNSASLGYLYAISSKVSLDSEITARHTDVLSSSHDEAPNSPGPYAYYRPYDTTPSSNYERPDYAYVANERLLWEQTRGSNLTVGVESSFTVVPTAYGSTRRFRYVNNAAYLQQIWGPWEWLSLTAGYRYDYSTIYGAANTPRIGTVITPMKDLSIKLLASSGFRAPTAWELFNATNQRKANPDLKPERLRSYEFGVGYRFFRRYYVSVQQYYNRINNLLLEVQTAEPNPNQSGTNWNQNQNVGRATIYGTEVETDVQISNSLGLFLNYTYNHGKYEDLSYSLTSSPSTRGRTGDDPLFDATAAAVKQTLGRSIVPASGSIPNIAPHHANAGVTWKILKNVTAFFGINYVDIRRTVATNPEKTVPGYAMGTLNLRWEDAFLSGLDFSLLVRNAGNQQFFDPGIRAATGSYYPTEHPLEKRNIWLTAGYRF